ncbi:hypothetical protein OROGR_000597 [Orobanche gracilis]
MGLRPRVSIQNGFWFMMFGFGLSDLGSIVTESENGAGQNIGNAEAVHRRCAAEEKNEFQKWLLG